MRLENIGGKNVNRVLTMWMYLMKGTYDFQNTPHLRCWISFSVAVDVYSSGQFRETTDLHLNEQMCHTKYKLIYLKTFFN